MPEGDTVYLACRRLHAALAGRVLTRAELRVPSLATVNLAGRSVTGVVARGKHQLLRLSGGLTLHTHLRMDGAWRVVQPGRLPPGPAHQIRVLLANADATAVGLRLPVVELLDTADERRAVGHLGPDLLGPDWNLEEALRRLNAQPDRTIGEALLDQRNLAGIGTFYRAETLFLSGVHPRTPVRDVGRLAQVVERAHALLTANLRGGRQITTGSLSRGGGRYVFGRSGRPCLRCGTLIEDETYGPSGQERLSYWCPRCQPDPRVQRL